MPNHNDIKKSFNKSHDNYDNSCHVQKMVGTDLIRYLKQHSEHASHILDLGCGTGLITEKLANEYHYHTFHAIDLAPLLLCKAKERLQPLGISVTEANFDDLPAFDCGFDIIFSNMALHWSASFNPLLKALKSFLTKKGLLAFSIPLLGTFCELEGRYAYNDFLSAALIDDELKDQGYDRLMYHQEKFILPFEHSLAAFRSIKNVGANHVTTRANKGLRGKSFIKQFDIKQLTYIIGYFIAQKREVL